jgi:signal transduction histidine kinase
MQPADREPIRAFSPWLALGAAAFLLVGTTIASGFWLGTNPDLPRLEGHDFAFAWAAGQNFAIAGAYLVLGLWWVRQLRLHPLGRLAGSAFFVACAFTHIDLAIHAIEHVPTMIETHMFWIHGAQAVVDWTFVIVAWHHRGMVVETESQVKARERYLESVEALAQVREEERKRWARELHDQTLQGLAGVSIALGAAARESNGSVEVIARARAALDEEIGSLRSLISELRPPVLDTLGLEAGIRALCDTITERNGVEVDLRLDVGSNGAAPLAEELESTIYRIVQEALTNVGRHSRAERVGVSVERDGADVSIEVRDDGVGFDPAAVDDGYGLIGIRERATIAGGRAEIDSSPGLGTTVRVRVPAISPFSPAASA